MPQVSELDKLYLKASRATKIWLLMKEDPQTEFIFQSSLLAVDITLGDRKPTFFIQDQ